jgi:hypothetical protein
MRRPLRKLLGVIGLGVNWGIVWGGLFGALVSIIGAFRPQDIPQAEGPFPASGIGLVAGLICGTTFGLILAFAEDGKRVVDLKLIRVTAWGVLASAVWPLFTSLPYDMILYLCPAGGAYAMMSLAIARRFELRQSKPSLLFKVVGRSLRDPLRAACAR